MTIHKKGKKRNLKLKLAYVDTFVQPHYFKTNTFSIYSLYTN